MMTKTRRQRDSRDLGVVAYAPRLGKAYSGWFSPLNAQVLILPQGDSTQDFERLQKAGYVIELLLPQPFPNAVLLDEFLASRQTLALFEEIKADARESLPRSLFGVKGRWQVKLGQKALLGVATLRKGILAVPAVHEIPGEVRTSLGIWMHWFSPTHFELEVEEFEHASEFRRLISLDARQFGVVLDGELPSSVILN